MFNFDDFNALAGGVPLARFAAQLAATILLSRLVAIVLRHLGQSPVIAEVVAGICLGPTLLGQLSPALFGALFPPESIGLLKLFAQVGIALFMFGVGLEFDERAVREKGRAAIVISFVSISVPFTLGLLLARPLAHFAGQPKASLAFSLFIATAMSVTAFPVLARIIRECNVAPPVAALALTGAAVDDVSAWILLAIVISIAKNGSFAGTLTMIASVVVFGTVMLRIVPVVLARWRRSALMPLLLLACSAAVAEWIGVHAVFGAFAAGVVVPLSPEERAAYRRKLQPVAMICLPLFFAFSGLRTDLRLLMNGSMLIACVAVLAAATAGKFGGGTIAARSCGVPWTEALTIGALMNTRGLMELVVLNIGLDLGILSRDLFAVFVVMALVTTFAAGPALRLLERYAARQEERASGALSPAENRVIAPRAR